MDIIKSLSNSKAGGDIWRGESTIIIKMGCLLNQDGVIYYINILFESLLNTLPLLTFWSRKHDLRGENLKKTGWDMIKGKAE